MATTPQTTLQGGTNAISWVDLASPSHPFIFAAPLDDLPITPRTTVRKKTETVDLATDADLNPVVMGRDFDNVTLRKFGIMLRTAQISL